jgi:hemerythrin-like domain-containing protein
MRPTEDLKHKHDIILKVIGAAEREVLLIGETGEIDAEQIAKMLDFFRNFTDRCHQAKEEQHRFVIVEKRDQPRNMGPIAVMLQEHAMGRARVKTIVNALPQAQKGDSSSIASLKDNPMIYENLLEAHITKENHALFLLADRLFIAKDQEELAMSSPKFDEKFK